MDLLANYGSDEEDEESTKPPTAMPSSSSKLFSLPPPRSSHQGEKVNVVPLVQNIPRFPSATEPQVKQRTLPSDFFEQTSSVAKVSAEDGENPSSLFLQLPAPSSTKSLRAHLPTPSDSKLKKKMVEFKPPVNLVLLESTDEDDSERRKKRSKVSEQSRTGPEGKVGGLTALLPPPKNSLGLGQAFGGGASGRRTAMETGSVSSQVAKEANTFELSALDKESDSVAPPSAGNLDAQMRAHPSTRFHYSAQPRQGHVAPESDYCEPELRTNEGHFAEYQHTYQSNGHQDQTSWQYSDAYWDAALPVSASVVSDPLAEVLRRERRKGKNEPPLHVIEVKQADLTGEKLREDQLRTTGIAFGPSYQPVSSGKDKPSKIHRKKHQIGALYFDMKSKEMEMLDRRSKGNLTKAETHAKYGW